MSSILAIEFGLRLPERFELGAAGARDDLDDAAGGVRRSARVLGAEALVVVVMAIEDEVSAARVQGVPERSNRAVGSV